MILTGNGVLIVLSRFLISIFSGKLMGSTRISVDPCAPPEKIDIGNLERTIRTPFSVNIMVKNLILA